MRLRLPLGSDPWDWLNVVSSTSTQGIVSLVGGIGYGEARLTVSDDGRGLKNPNKDGSGLKLIASLAKQIDGAVNQEKSDRGTTTTLTFPLMV